MNEIPPAEEFHSSHQILPFASSRIDGLFPSFGTYSIVVAMNYLSAESRSLLAQLMPLVRREIPHEHGSTTCAYKRVSGVNIGIFLSTSASACSSPLFVYQFSPYCSPTVAFLSLSTFFKIYALFAELPYKALTIVWNRT